MCAQLFHGSLNDVLSKFSVRALRDKLSEAFDTYLPSTSLEQASRIVQLNGACCAVLCVRAVLDVRACAGLRYLPVDRNSYLRAHCFVNQLEQMFRLMRTSVLLFHDYVVWSGVDQADMLSVYEMIVSTVSSAASMVRGAARVTGVCTCACSLTTRDSRRVRRSRRPRRRRQRAPASWWGPTTWVARTPSLT